MPARVAVAAPAQEEKPICALHQLKPQVCRPSTYVDEVTRRRHPDVAAAREDANRDTSPEPVRNEKKTETKRVRKHVHFAEDEGYASATSTPAPRPKVCSSPSLPGCVAEAGRQHQQHDGCEIKAVCGERHDDRGRVVGKSGSDRVPKPVHKDEPSRQPQAQQAQPSRTVTSRKATSQRTSKTKKRPRMDKTSEPAVQNTGGSYRNQYGNIVFEDFF